MMTMADPGLRVAALQTNEVDYLEYAPVDFLPRLRANRSMVVSQVGGQAELMYCASLNHYLPPFDNVLVRRAVQQALDREEILAAVGFGPGLGQPDCASLFMCGANYSNTEGSALIQRPSLDRARALLREAGYANERVVLLHPVEFRAAQPLWPGADRPAEAGRLQPGCAGQRLGDHRAALGAEAAAGPGRLEHRAGGLYRLQTFPPAVQHGGRLQLHGQPALGLLRRPADPGDRGLRGGIRPAKRRELAGTLQRLAFEAATFPIAGQFRAPAVWRSELRGVIDFGFPVIWNIERPGR